MKDVPVSAQFDDIYFSKEDGLAETAYVFLKGNDLPRAWADKDSFTICETGFGTGLNFFSAWKLFEETAKNGQTLDYISFEKYPLTPKEIHQFLSHWEGYFEGRFDVFLKQYPIRIAGFHRIKITPAITLTLIFDDINEALPQLQANVDCWFLDGFTPSKNPDMWSTLLYEQMARLSHQGASFASFTASSPVRQGLANVGFKVEKAKGFGRKREMIKGYFDKPTSIKNYPSNKQKKIAIVGAGLAGTSLAYVLKSYGFFPVIYEASNKIASGASGNSIGLYNPRFSKMRDDLSDFFAPAYAQLIRIAKQAGEKIDYNPCGALHLMTDEAKSIRYTAMAKNWQWHEDHIKVVNGQQASDLAGIEIQDEALYLPDSGSVSPQKLCEYYAKDIEVIYNSNIRDLSQLKEDIIILTCGGAVNNFKELSWLNLDIVRGQITNVKSSQNTKKLKCNIHYGGYMSTAQNGVHSIGSTFEKWIDYLDVTDKNHEANIQTLKSNVTIFKDEHFIIESGRAGMRAATNDRFPVIGRVPNHQNIYVSSAFGSHGIVASITGAHLIADIIRGGALSLTAKTLYQLSPRRFIDREAKKGRVLV